MHMYVLWNVLFSYFVKSTSFLKKMVNLLNTDLISLLDNEICSIKECFRLLVLEGRRERKRKAQDKLKDVEESLKPPPPKK